MADSDPACELMPLSATDATTTAADDAMDAVVAPAAAHSPSARTGGSASASSLPSAYASYLRQLVSACPDLPRVTLRYTDLAYTLQLPLKQHVVPTLASALPLRVQAAVQRARGGGVAHTLRMEALSACSGTIPAGSMTLILAPPGHGKSAFLKVSALTAGSSERRAPNGNGPERSAHPPVTHTMLYCSLLLSLRMCAGDVRSSER